MTLYEIADEMARVNARLMENGGEIDDATLEDLNTLDGLFADKALSIVHVIKNMQQKRDTLKAKAAVFSAEAKRLTDKAEGRDKAAKGLQDYLKREMKRLDMRELKTDTFEIYIQTNSAIAVEWVGNGFSIPPYLQAPAVADKGMIKTLMQGQGAPEQVEAVKYFIEEGVITVTQGDHLRIK